MVLEKPTRCHTSSTALECNVGFVCASIFSLAYVMSPLFTVGCAMWAVRRPYSWAARGGCSVVLMSVLFPGQLAERVGSRVLVSWPMQCILKYFRFEEYHEIPDEEIRNSGRNYLVGMHPHGVFSFAGLCAALSTMGASEGFGSSLAKEAPTAVASVVKSFPFLKDILGMFGIVDASGKTLSKRLSKKVAIGRTSSACLYIGGMLELFYSSPRREAVFLSGRKGFVKLAMREGADIIPTYLFGNTTVLSALSWGPLAALSRKLGVSVTLFWGRWLLPVPRPVQLVYARGRPIGLPHIQNPTQEDVDKWHGVYCEKLQELFENYKGKHPDYKNKKLEVE